MSAQDITAPICFCGAPTHYIDSADLYHGKSYGMRWICTRFPECRGSVGAHPDGRPLGTVPNEATIHLRKELHEIVDRIWKGKYGREKQAARRQAYLWLSSVTGIPSDQCHIGMFDEQTCRRALEAVKANPYKEDPKTASQIREDMIERMNAATRNRIPGSSPEQLEELRRKVKEHKDQPREFVVESVDKPYLDTGIFKGRWVVHVVMSDGLTSRPTDELFADEEQAQAYYKEIAA